jgi:surfeit locus 1 family protein
MRNLQFCLADYRFRPSWLGTLITIMAIPLFIKLGLWQYQKAEMKQSLQIQQDQYAHTAAVTLPSQVDDPASWRYRRVRLTGIYDAAHQILIDNQVHEDRVGFHVLTPLVTEANTLVLVNRGWVAGATDHKVWLPASKFYSLESPAQLAKTSSWTPVWQNLDMKRYASLMDKPVMPVVIRLDPEAPGGYVRDWPKPAERIATHIGYAYQWFGFAVATLCIYLYVSFRKKTA